MSPKLVSELFFSKMMKPVIGQITESLTLVLSVAMVCRKLDYKGHSVSLYFHLNQLYTEAHSHLFQHLFITVIENYYIA